MFVEHTARVPERPHFGGQPTADAGREEALRARKKAHWRMIAAAIGVVAILLVVFLLSAKPVSPEPTIMAPGPYPTVTSTPTVTQAHNQAP